MRDYEPDEDEKRDAAESRKRHANSQCACGYPDMPGYCPGPRNCPMVGMDEADDSPYCECGNEPIEQELMDNVCDACGKRLT